MTFEEAYYGIVKKKRIVACLNSGFFEQLKALSDNQQILVTNKN